MEADAAKSMNAMFRSLRKEWRSCNRIEIKVDAGASFEFGLDNNHDMCYKDNDDILSAAHACTTCEKYQIQFLV